MFDLCRAGSFTGNCAKEYRNIGAKPSWLQEIYPTFDAQNMPKDANNKQSNDSFVEKSKMLT